MMLPPIYNILTAATAVTAIVGTRIYPHGEAPQDVTRPYVAWFLVAGIPEQVLDGAPDTDRATVQIDCWHQSGSGVVQLASAVRLAIEPHAHVTNLFLNSRDRETGLYRFALELDYWHPR